MLRVYYFADNPTCPGLLKRKGYQTEYKVECCGQSCRASFNESLNNGMNCNTALLDKERTCTDIELSKSSRVPLQP